MKKTGNQIPQYLEIEGGSVLPVFTLPTALIAQLVERPLSEREVVGSNPVAAPYQRCKNGTSSSLADAGI